MYVSDWGNNRVQKFSADGEFLLSYGGGNLQDGSDLDHPSDVAVDSEGDVYVVDWGNLRVQIYDPEGDVITALYGDATEFSNWAKEVVEANPDVTKAYRRVKDITPMGRLQPAGRHRRRRTGPHHRHGQHAWPAAGVRQREGLHGPAVQPVGGSRGDDVGFIYVKVEVSTFPSPTSPRASLFW